MRGKLLAPTNKRDFYTRYLKGEFGNRPRLWESLEELLASGFDGLVSIRSMVPGGVCLFRVPVADLRSGARVIDSSNVIFQESLPDEFLVIQGSLSMDELGMVLEYSTEPNKKFREAEGAFKTARGMRAHYLLHSLLEPSSHSDLFLLLDMYDQCIIEFAAYSVDVGIIPNRRMVIFEVRGY